MIVFITSKWRRTRDAGSFVRFAIIKFYGYCYSSGHFTQRELARVMGRFDACIRMSLNAKRVLQLLCYSTTMNVSAVHWTYYHHYHVYQLHTAGHKRCKLILPLQLIVAFVVNVCVYWKVTFATLSKIMFCPLIVFPFYSAVDNSRIKLFI